MHRLTKAAPAFTMGIEGRTVTGIFAVHGNIDDGGDRSHPGLFGDFSVGPRQRVKFLWQHDPNTPPIAKIERLFEVGRADLPAAVLSYAPEATGGAAVARTYFEDDFASRVFNAVAADALDEMSYAYNPTRYGDWQEDENGRIFRDMFKAEIYDVSDVTWGMNPATSGAGKSMATEHGDVIAAYQAAHAAARSYIERCKGLLDLRAKEGRTISAATRGRLLEALETISPVRTGLGDIEKVLKELIDLSDPEKARKEAQAVYAAYQRTLAQLHGAL